MSKESVSIMYYQKQHTNRLIRNDKRVENWSTCYSFTLNDDFNMQSDIESGQSNTFQCVESETGLRSETGKKRKHDDGDCVCLGRGRTGLMRSYLASPWWLNLTALRDSNKSESSGWAKQAQPALPSVHRLSSAKRARKQRLAVHAAPGDVTTAHVQSRPRHF